MERLLIKYVKEIVEFEEALREKYKTDVILNIESIGTGLGEILKVTSEQGDSMTVWEENEEPIEYNFLPNKANDEFKIEVKHLFSGFDKYELDIVETDEGYRCLHHGNLSHKVFPTLSDLTEYFAKTEDYMTIGEYFISEIETTDTIYKKI